MRYRSTILRTALFTVGFFLLFVSIYGCGPSSTEKIQRQVSEQVQRTDGSYAEVINSFYRRRDYSPVWVEGEEPTDLGSELLQAVCNADKHALSSDIYDISDLQKNLSEAYAGDSLRDSLYYDEVAQIELAFTRLFFQYADDLLNGRTKHAEVTSTWHLETRRYPLLPVLQQLVKEEDMSVLRRHVGTDAQYKQLQEAFNRYRHIEREGGWPAVPEGPELGQESVGPRVYRLEEHLHSTGDLAGDAVGDSTFDERTVEAVERFQRRHGLEVTGTVGDEERQVLNVPAEARMRQLAVNLERQRWLPASLNGTRLTVNIPDFRLSVYKDDQQTMQMPAVVGGRMNETPVFSDTLRYVVFRPYWYVPTSIAVEEILPQFVDREDTLDLQQYEIVTGDRRPVSEERLASAEREEWEEKLKSRRWIIRHKPGPTNPLGDIKFMFPNAHNIYFHDTPADHLFARNTRTFSHGCIRVQRPVELAGQVLGSEWGPSRLGETFEKEGDPEQVDLAHPMPVYILYLTAWVDQSGRVNFRPDVYDHDPPLWKAIGGTNIRARASSCGSPDVPAAAG